MKQPRPNRRRPLALALSLFALLAALMVATGVAWADQPADAGVKNAPKNCNPSDPDGTENGGTDCIGGTSGNPDPDPNNGSGNESDCEDDNNGNGVPGHCKDVCDLIKGVQKDPLKCLPPVVVDLCPNLGGAQASVPGGLIMVDGRCVEPAPPAATDVCPNIADGQATIPAGLVMVDGQCVAPSTPGTGTTGTPAGTPATSGTTPTTGASTPTPTPTPTTGAAAPDAATPGTTPEATAGEAAASETAGPGAAEAEDTTVEATTDATTVPAGQATAGAGAAPSGELPFTGAPTWLVAIAGMLLMLAGTMVHRRAARVAAVRASR
ncbi:MAG: hypothetical protein JWL76_822 [Thermoleophilia bacterium]|nr:hypothetical protein [Thermoleophilia bacterium]